MLAATGKSASRSMGCAAGESLGACAMTTMAGECSGLHRAGDSHAGVSGACGKDQPPLAREARHADIVLDSGVDYGHIDLRSNIWERPDAVPAYYDDELGEFKDDNGYNGIQPTSDPMDDNGHGTHCAGIIGAEGDNSEGIAGVNWNVQIMPLKFLGRGGFGTTADAIKAINYAIDRKKAGVNLRVINASWGSTSSPSASSMTSRSRAPRPTSPSR